MLVRRTRLPVERNYLLGGFLLLAFVSMICVAFSKTGNGDFDMAKREILLRRIGHEVLLQSGDSTSRVLPVKKIDGNEYRIGFEKAFTFQPDSLVRITQRLLQSDPLGSNYVVNVLNCSDSSIAYGYAVSENREDDIIACLGRAQPKACYIISIRFQSAAAGGAKNGYLLGSLALLAVAGYLFLRQAKPRSALPRTGPAISGEPKALPDPSKSKFALGLMSFEAEARKLTIDGQTIDLTKTEARVLRIFAAAPNETIERSRLQKEIWEDEGVIVGRSLDMFISKLRKKLEPDPTIRLAVIRGKGYQLQLSSEKYPGATDH